MFALDDWLQAGVMFSRVHVTWAAAAGGRLGVGDDPPYLKATCFDTFPFPETSSASGMRIRKASKALSDHRLRQLRHNPELTITAIYNVLEKLRVNDVLTDKELVIHDRAHVGILKQMHTELDSAVFEAYGWPADAPRPVGDVGLDQVSTGIHL